MLARLVELTACSAEGVARFTDKNIVSVQGAPLSLVWWAL